MNIFNSCILSSCLLTGYLSAQGYGGNLPSQSYGGNPQPLKIEVYESDDEYDNGDQSQSQGTWGNRGSGSPSSQSDWKNKAASKQANFRNQICQAIQSQSRILATIKTKEVVGPRELKMTVQQVTIEPYAFGTTRDGLPVLKGNIVDEKDIRVVTIKVFEDRFNEKDLPAPIGTNKKGWFGSDTGVRLVDLRSIRDIQVVPNTHFDTPKDFKGFDDDGDLQIQVVCSVSSDGSQSSGNNSYNSSSQEQQRMYNPYNR